MATTRERTLIVPDVDNDGVSLASERAQVEAQLLALAGGYTADKVTGAWLDNGHTYYDTSTRYTLAVTADQDKAITARLPHWCALLRQQALYTSVRPVTVSFVTADTATQVA